MILIKLKPKYFCRFAVSYLAVSIFKTSTILAFASGSSLAAQSSNDILAKSGKVEMRRGELSDQEKAKLYDAEIQVYNTIEGIAVNHYIKGALNDYRLKNKLTGEVLAEKSFFKTKEVKDEQVNAFIAENKDNPNMQKIPEAERAKVIRGYLEGQARQEAVQAFVEQAKRKGEIQVALPKPIQPKIPVTDGNNPSIGPKSAKVTIVEFTDFQCPFCAKVEPTLKEVVKKYGDKVRLVVRDFPLPNHSHAIPAALAANCANSQGKYFEMKEKLFAHQDKLSDEFYQKSAKELKLETKKFETCLKDPATKAEVELDLREGEKFGVEGTPALFVNGRKTSGALDMSSLSKMIDEELALN